MVTAHALDFDLACVAPSEQEADRKIRLAVKTYIEFGLSSGWADEILFPAPEEYWDKLRDATITLGEPIRIVDTRQMLVFLATPRHRITPRHETHEAGGVAVPA